MTNLIERLMAVQQLVEGADFATIEEAITSLAAFAQPPASGVDRSREAVDQVLDEHQLDTFLSHDGRQALITDILNALTNSGAPVPGDERPVQAWIDRASQIESAARALLEGVDDLFKRADAGSGRLYAANRSVLEDRCDQLALAVNTPEPTLKAASPVPGDAGGAEALRLAMARCFTATPERMSMEPVFLGDKNLGGLWYLCNALAKAALVHAAPAPSDEAGGLNVRLYALLSTLKAADFSNPDVGTAYADEAAELAALIETEAGIPAGMVQALRDALDHYERNICRHEETHRGGSIWTICDGCGAKWADDEGGFKPFEYPPEIERAFAMLAAAPRQAAPTDEAVLAFQRIVELAQEGGGPRSRMMAMVRVARAQIAARSAPGSGVGEVGDA